MANNTRKTVTIALGTTLTTNLLNCAVTSLAGPIGVTLGQPYLLIHRISILNKTAAAATFSLWKGATGANAAGTEVFGQGLSVPANQSFERYCDFRMDAADFLVGGSNTATALVMTVEFEIGFAS